MTFTVGITGGIASGKTTVTHYFNQKGIQIVDADIVAREVVAPQTSALTEIRKHFGSNILNKDGSLNRKYLRNIIFNDLQKKQWLEALLHPLIRQQIIQKLKQATSSYPILVSPLLLETKQYLLVNRIMVIDVPEEQQIARTMKRDQCTQEQAKSIIGTQLSRKEREKHADDLVYNNGSLSSLYSQLEQLHTAYLKAAEKHSLR